MRRCSLSFVVVCCYCLVFLVVVSGRLLSVVVECVQCVVVCCLSLIGVH